MRRIASQFAALLYLTPKYLRLFCPLLQCSTVGHHNVPASLTLHCAGKAAWVEMFMTELGIMFGPSNAAGINVSSSALHSRLCSGNCVETVCSRTIICSVVQCAVWGNQCAVYCVQCAVCSVQCAMFSVQCAVFSLQCELCSVQC